MAPIPPGRAIGLDQYRPSCLDDGVAPRTGSSSVVAVDVGGTGIKAALVDAGGHQRRAVSAPTPVADGPDAVVRAIRNTVTGLADGAGAVGVAIAVPGTVDVEAGVAGFAANLGWHDVPLRALVQADTGLPVVLDRDAHAAGVAELTIGAAGAADDSLIAVIGTGIVAVITAAGRPVAGAAGLAGEFGHMPVWPDGEDCPCGQRGCLERYASAAAIGRRYEALTGRTGGAAEVVERRAGDPDAARVWADAVHALAIAFASCTMLLDPALIVITGGLAQAGDALRDPVRAALAERVVWRDCPAVEISTLGPRAGLLGAAVLAWRAAGRTDFAAW